MKRCFVFALALCLLLTACGGGDVSQVQVEIGDSAFFTREEVEDAMNVALDYFDREFEGCTMTMIEYDEDKSRTAAMEWAQQIGDKEGIILYSSFDVDDSGGDGSFTPNGTYSRWQWILTRNEGEDWVLRTWGYG